MMEEIIAEQREGEEEATERIVFPRVHTLELLNLPNLTSFYKRSYNLEWPSLVTLTIEKCRSIETFAASRDLCTQKLKKKYEGFNETEGDVGMSTHPLFNDKVAFPALEILKVNGLYNLKEMWCPQLPANSFSQLRVVKVKDCQKLLNVIPSTLLRQLQSLEKISVKECDSVEKVVEFEGQFIEEGRTIGILSHLQILRLRKLPKLRHMWLDKYPHGTRCFQNLSSLYIYKCDGLRKLFSPSIASGLVQLQEVEIDSCEMMEAIVAEVREGEENPIEIVFPQVHTLKLKDLPKFYTGGCTLKFPSLKKLLIANCPKMTSFTSTFLSPQKLKRKEEGFEGTPEESNLPQPLFDEKVAFTELENLYSGNMHNVQEIFHNQLPAESFGQLKILKVESCDKLLRVASSNLLPRLQILEQLTVKKCCSMEKVFELDCLVVGEGLATISLSQLEELELHNLPNLKIFYSGNYTLEWPSLKSVSLKACPKMQRFSSGFISTPKLNTVKVEDEQLWKGDLNSTVQHLFQVIKGKLESKISSRGEEGEEEMGIVEVIQRDISKVEEEKKK